MARQIVVDLVSDTADFERSMKSAGGAAGKFEADLKSADAATSKFDDGLGKVSDGLGSSTEKFRSTADLAGGLGDVLGIAAVGPIAAYATGFADIADGLGGLLAPALAKANVLFKALNLTMLTNPIFLVIAALVALTAGFVIAYKKSETFRQIVNGAFTAIKDGAFALRDAVVSAFKFFTDKIVMFGGLILAPYKAAFNAIAWAWNNTVGRLEVDIPGFMGFGGIKFGVPDIPMLAKGGIVNGPTLAMIGEKGPEAVVPLSGPNSRGLGGGGRVEIHLTGDTELVALMRKSIKNRGGNVQVVLGS